MKNNNNNSALNKLAVISRLEQAEIIAKADFSPVKGYNKKAFKRY